MTTLHPAAFRVLRMPGWKVRIWLAVVITLALGSLPGPVAGLALWVLALPYLMMAETLARMVGEGHQARRSLEAEHQGHISLLAERDTRIAALEADLARAGVVSGVGTETKEQRLYGQVGLCPGAPDFLVLAARRAFRSALHPDRHPRHARRAHERYLRAQAIFDEIEKLRA